MSSSPAPGSTTRDPLGPSLGGGQLPASSAVAARSLESCHLFVDPMDCSPPGFSVHGISQARILEWAAISSSRGSS